MSKENMSAVNSGGEKKRLSPQNKARALHGWEWFNHAQTAGGAILALTNPSLLAFAGAAVYGAWNELGENRLIRKKRKAIEKEHGLKEGKKYKLFRRKQTTHARDFALAA